MFQFHIPFSSYCYFMSLFPYDITFLPQLLHHSGLNYSSLPFYSSSSDPLYLLPVLLYILLSPYQAPLLLPQSSLASIAPTSSR